MPATPTTLAAVGSPLIAGGYLVIPIRQRDKRPSITDWQTARLTDADCARYPGDGAGVLCGQGDYPLATIDIDTGNADLAARFAAWCRDALGAAPERVGQPPRRLLVYRAEQAGWAKTASAYYADASGGRHRLELLGRGQQCVAYGVHPATGQPYRWEAPPGGLVATAARELPVLPQARIADVLAAWDRLARACGLTPVEGGNRLPVEASAALHPLEAYSPPVGLSLDDARRLLAAVDHADYDDWLRAGMALHHEFGGAPAALALWDDWSSGAPNYEDPDDLARRWARFGAAADRPPVTMRWLLSRRPGDAPARTEFGLAKRFASQHGGSVMYAPELDAWHHWDGARWRRSTGVDVEARAQSTIRALADETEAATTAGARAACAKYAAKCQTASTVQSVIRLARCHPRIAVGAASLDASPWLLGVGNGLVDLRTGTLLPPDPAHRVTVATPVEYHPEATCPVFDATVLDVFGGDAELASFLRRLTGYSLMGQPKESVLVIPYGSGCNGKSTVLGAIRDALGEHARTASADTFLASSSSAGAGAAREDVLRLRGARYVYVTEPDEGCELREGLVKAMTGGEPLPARGLYAKTTIEVRPTWVVHMPTNHRPIVKGDDYAIWRRLLTVPFARNFDDDPGIVKDPDRPAKLALEAPGILAWCVRGALEYQRLGLQPPEAVQASRSAYRADMDLLADWIDSCCDVGREYASATGALWLSWETYARSRGELKYIASARALGRRLASRGFDPIQHSLGIRGRGFGGLRVRPPDL